MAKLNVENIERALGPHMPAGETIEEVTYAIKRPGFLVRVALGSIGTALFKKKHLVAVTRNNLIIAEFRRGLKLKEVQCYSLDDLPEITVFRLGLTVTFTIRTDGSWLKLRAYPWGLHQNRHRARAVATRIQGAQLATAAWEGIREGIAQAVATA